MGSWIYCGAGSDSCIPNINTGQPDLHCIAPSGVPNKGKHTSASIIPYVWNIHVWKSQSRQIQLPTKISHKVVQHWKPPSVQCWRWCLSTLIPFTSIRPICGYSCERRNGKNCVRYANFACLSRSIQNSCKTEKQLLYLFARESQAILMAELCLNSA